LSDLDVLYVYRDAWRSSGGLAIDVHNLANALSDRGYKVGVATVEPDRSSNGAAYRFAEGIQVTELRPLPAGRPYALAGGIRRLVQLHPNAVVHVFSCLPAYMHFAAMISARRHRRPLVWTPMIHPSRGTIWGDYGTVGVAMRLFDSVAPRMARLANAIAASTEAEAEAFRVMGCQRVEVIPPAVDDMPPATSAEASLVRERFGVGDAPLVVTVLGRNELRKGVSFCFDAFKRLRQRLPDAQLLLVGPSDIKSPCPDGAQLVGRLSDIDLTRALRAADVVFVPSSYEAFSRVVIEAWQQETPVVVTDGVGLAETVQKLGGQVVPYGDDEMAAGALESFLTDSDLAVRCGIAGRSVVEERFVVGAVTDHLQEIYRDIRFA
jgi:glycosyltransferase involved in cell wall biosynthesis